MENTTTFIPVKRIITSQTSPGLPWGKDEFCPSCHPGWREVLIALEGRCRYMMNNSVYIFEPGTVGLISPGCIHASEYTSQDHDLLHLWIHFPGPHDMLGILLKVTRGGKYGKVPLKNNPVLFPPCIQELFLRRWKQLESCVHPDEKTIQELMELPCQLLLNEFSLQWEGVLPALNEPTLSSFLQSYIRSRIGNGCSIARLAELSGYSPSHVSHVFLRETGQSVGEFINAVRISYTAEALKQGIRQKSIAAELGFSSARAFWNWMQKIPELQKEQIIKN